MGRADLIGNGKQHLVPAWQPADGPGRPQAAEGRCSVRARFARQHTALSTTCRTQPRSWVASHA